MDDLDPTIVAAMLFQLAFDLPGIADQKKFLDARILAQSHDRAADQIGRTEIAAHGVECDFHREAGIFQFPGGNARFAREKMTR